VLAISAVEIVVLPQHARTTKIILSIDAWHHGYGSWWRNIVGGQFTYYLYSRFIYFLLIINYYITVFGGGIAPIAPSPPLN